LVDGTHRADRHGDAAKARDAAAKSAASFGPLTRPKYLKRFALEAWKRYIEPASWLDASREPAAIAFCELWQELRLAPANFQAAKHSQLRAYMGDLGLTSATALSTNLPRMMTSFSMADDRTSVRGKGGLIPWSPKGAGTAQVGTRRISSSGEFE
jgi:hypothetical protein